MAQNRKMAYLDAMKATGGNPGPDDSLAESRAMRESFEENLETRELSDELERNLDPTTQDEDVFFVDPSKFDREVFEGDRVVLEANVQSLGSKIGLTLDSVEVISSADGDEGSEESPGY